MDAIAISIRQSLFIYASPSGETWEFAALEDGGCATLCDGRLVATADGSEASVGRIMELFLVAASVRPPRRISDAFPPVSREEMPAA